MRLISLNSTNEFSLSYIPIYCKTHMRSYNLGMFDHSNKIEKRNQKQIENISYLYNPKEDVADYIKERQKKIRNFEKSNHSDVRKRKGSKQDMETETIPKNKSSTPKRTALQLDGVTLIF